MTDLDDKIRAALESATDPAGDFAELNLSEEFWKLFTAGIVS